MTAGIGYLTAEIGHFKLQPGQWVVINDTPSPKETKKYGPFKVINNDVALLDACRCFLMDKEGVLFDYCPRTGYLGNNFLFNYKVRVIGKESLVKEFGNKLEEIEKKALEHLKQLAQKPHFGYGYNPDGYGFLDAEEIKKKYGLVQTEPDKKADTK